jgi:hypothetical protein
LNSGKNVGKQRTETGMKIGIVISGGDVSGINNFIFQIARLASADITLLMAEYPDCWIKIIRNRLARSG